MFYEDLNSPQSLCTCKHATLLSTPSYSHAHLIHVRADSRDVLLKNPEFKDAAVIIFGDH